MVNLKNGANRLYQKVYYYSECKALWFFAVVSSNADANEFNGQKNLPVKWMNEVNNFGLVVRALPARRVSQQYFPLYLLRYLIHFASRVRG